MSSITRAIIAILVLSERLKNELRHSWLSSGRQESVAEHTWQMAFMALLCAEHLDHPVDLAKTLKMILIHDLVEAITGDIPVTEISERKNLKAVRERETMDSISKMIPGEISKEIFFLWHEFEECTSPEAKFAKALDNLEAQIQHNLADLETWEENEFDLVYTKMNRYCTHDKFLDALCRETISQAEERMKKFGRNPEEIRSRCR